MKAALKTLMGLAIVFGTLALARAEEDKKADTKEVTLKGEIGCPKCVFSIAKACGNAIKVKEGDKEVIYTFLDKGAKESYHKEICTEGKPGKVTGTVSKKDGKNFIKPSKDGVKFD
jgi:hypothetical protein